MKDMKSISQADQSNLGATIASVKADLHEAQDALSEARIGSIDWVKLLINIKKLLDLLVGLTGTMVSDPASPPTHPVPKDSK